jgi:hypothetical protein
LERGADATLSAKVKDLATREERVCTPESLT